jgi:hypothetical protein
MNKTGGLAQNVQNTGQMQQAELAADQHLLTQLLLKPLF